VPDLTYEGWGLQFRYPQGWNVTPDHAAAGAAMSWLNVQRGNTISRFIERAISPNRAAGTMLPEVQITVDKGPTPGIDLELDQTEHILHKRLAAPNVSVTIRRVTHPLGPALDVSVRYPNQGIGRRIFARHSLIIFPPSLQQDIPYHIRSHVEVGYYTNRILEPELERTFQMVIAHLKLVKDREPHRYSTTLPGRRGIGVK
jgi:hypothetical protein